MNRKIVILAAALIVAGCAQVFAFGIGLQLNGNIERNMRPGPAITFKTDSIPLVFALSYNLSGDPAIGLTGDYWALNKRLVNLGSVPLNWFFGVGFYINTIFADEFVLNGGIRVPLGLNMFIADGFIEPFVQIAPSFGVVLVPALDIDGVFWPIAAGFRLWFK